MTLLAAWVLLPLVLGVLSLGCGLLLELAAGLRLPAPLVLPAGFAVVIAASQFPPLSSATASLAAPLVAALAVVGLALSRGRLRELAEPWAPAAALGALAAYAAPVVLSGRATFAGYIKLDDTATYLAMLDRVETHGRTLAGLAPSTYEATLATSLDYGYPLGSFAPLGVAQRLLGIDAAWLWQPYLAFLGALLALVLYALAGRLVASRPLRALVAFVAAQPAILYGYSLWGGIKELAMALLLALLCACVPLVLERGTVRSVLPLAAAAAAVVGVLSLGGAVWLAPLLPALVLVVRFKGASFALRAALGFAAFGLVLAIPAIAAAVRWLPRSGAFTSESELGNLVGPLRFAQVAGIWPVGDFRRPPSDLAPTYVLIGVLGAAAAGGVAWAWLRQAWDDLLYVFGALLGALVLYEFGSPWVAGKSLATAAPALLLLALAAAAALFASGRRVEASVLALAIVGGVAWSNVLAYRDVWLAPRSRLADLEAIGERYAGQGPALMTEFDPYGARHFLRKLDAEGASELRRSLVPLRSGLPLEPQAYADVDRFQLVALLPYRLLVLRRSPLQSRPPSEYRLVERRRWYEVWRRDDSAPVVVEHLPLGDELDPAGVPRCSAVQRLAAIQGVRRLVASPRRRVAVFSLDALPHPADWTRGFVPGSLDPRSSGSVSTRFRATAGRYEVWIGGSFLGRYSARVDGRSVGSSRHELEWSGQLVDLGSVRLRTGPHAVSLRYDAGGWRPGTKGVAPFPSGPLIVAPVEAPRLLSVTPAEASSLCGRRLDWVEAVAA